MSARNFNSQALRQLAQEFLQKVAEDQDIPAVERDDFITSLVRQWMTYDGNATFFIGDEQVYLTVGKTPLGKYTIVPQPAGPGWVENVLLDDWKIDPEKIPAVLEQLNLGQGAEVTNTDGIPLRLSVNPKKRSRKIQPLVKVPTPAEGKNYHKIAARVLEKHVGMVDEKEMAALSDSVVKQWQRFQGHASIFLAEGCQLSLKITEQRDGGCGLATSTKPYRLEPLLQSLGFKPEAVPEIIAHINLGHTIRFPSPQGIPSLLWHDPKADDMIVRPSHCPKCAGQLRPWQHHERQQQCPHCRIVISLT